jgi:hypothetical protein
MGGSHSRYGHSDEETDYCLRRLAPPTGSHFTDRDIPHHSTLGQTYLKAPIKKTELRGFGPRANSANRATAACWRSSANFYR